MFERKALAGILVAALAACGGDHDGGAPSAQAEKTVAKASAAPSASAAPVAASAAEASSTAASTVASAEAPASIVPILPTVVLLPSARPSGKPSTATFEKGSSNPSGKTKVVASIPDLPTPANGILPSGAADKILKAGEKPTVKVLDEGEEPRAKAAYSLAKGSEQKLELLLDMAVGMRVDTQLMPPTTMPRMSMSLSLVAGDKTDASDVKIQAKLLKVGIEAHGPAEQQIADALKPKLEPIKGLGMSYWVSPQGYVRDLKMDDNRIANDGGAAQIVQGMTQSFESMVAKLPSEPIGVGARWEIVSRVSNSGADLLQFEVYTLKKRADSKLSVEVVLAQLVADSAMHPPNLPPGATAKITSFSSHGEGESELEEKHIAADEGSLRTSTNMELAVKEASAPAQVTRVETTMNVRYRKPK